MSATPSPALATSLSDARRQLHHAAQLATAAGISFLPKRADDSHTNLEWLARGGLLASNVISSTRPFRVAVRAADLTLCLLTADGEETAAYSLHGRTLDDAAAWLRPRVGENGADPSRFTLARHYEIPHHPVDDGAAFDTSDARAFTELAGWFDIAHGVLETLHASAANVSEVRCWPHHFDIAVLIDVASGKTIGVGLEPGDVYYDEPYFYVNMYPRPAEPPTSELEGRGSWHTHEWLGAVLPVSRLGDSTLREDVAAFIQSAIAASRTALG